MLAADYEAITSALTAPGSPFRTVPVRIDGRDLLGWEQAPPTLRALLDASAAHGDATFIVIDDDRLSYRDHHALVVRCAAALRDRHGIGKGDRVAIAMRNLPEWSIAFWAVIALGGVAVSINAWMTGVEMEYCLADSRSKLLIADDDRIAALSDAFPRLNLQGVVAVRSRQGARADVTPWEDFLGASSGASLPDVRIDPDDDATILYTSGTTGQPKGALGSHRGSCHNIINLCYFNAVDRLARGHRIEDVVLASSTNSFLLSMPLFHGAGCQFGLIHTMFSGGKVVMMHRWDAARALDLIERERITSLGGAPTHFLQLLDALQRQAGPRDLSSIETALVGGASPPVDLPARLRSAMPQAAIGTGYGQTECTQVATWSSGSDYLDHPMSCGRPVPICDMRIVGESDAPVSPGATGELLLRTPTLVKEYINRPDQTAETFQDGWLRTGDLAHVDAEGRLYIDDRKKDMVIRGGENIYCVEIEQALYSHADVVEAAVFGMPHAILGEEPVASVRLRPDAVLEEAELRAHLAVRLARFKIPARIAWCTEPLPRNANGKIMKRDLRAALLAEASAAEAVQRQAR